LRRIVHYYPDALGDSGVTFALWSWARAQAASGAEVAVLHAPMTAGPRRNVAFVSKECGAGLTKQSVPHSGSRRLTLRPVGLERFLGREDLLVLHEGWVPSNLIAAAAAARAGVPYIVMPHGVYDHAWTAYLKGPRWVRDHFERRLLERAAGVHVFFDTEAPDIRALAPAARFLTVPTGFELPDDRWAGGGGYLAWIGRIDPTHKGLDMLVRALARLTPRERPALRIRGYDYKGGVARLQQLIAECRLANWVRIEQAVGGADKMRFLQQADGYVHPSRWESHSIALLENLALGVPCLVSRTIHIASTLERSAAAILSPPREHDMALALARLPAQRGRLAEGGRALIGNHFNWDRLMPRFYLALRHLGVN
jgi:glycosyltransferase involved in cell wall biosynthesis